MSRNELVFDFMTYIANYAEYLNSMSTTLLYAMQNYRCVFLGLSMIDPNLLRIIVRANEDRPSPGCWGIVFGPIMPELKKSLEELGLAVVDKTSKDGFEFSLFPRQMLNAIGANVDLEDRRERVAALIQ